VWRVGRGPDPLKLPDPLTPDELWSAHTGNRFDSALGAYSVLYFGTHLEACYGETTARVRPHPAMVDVVGDEWDKLGFMEVGALPADWRHRRLAVRVEFPQHLPFIDVVAVETREELRLRMAEGLAFLGYEDITLGTVMGDDRRVTRWISQWAHDQLNDDDEPIYAGVRYLSKMSEQWECWAVFDDVKIVELERITIEKDDPELQAVARQYGLTVH
jgi:hypothetical protein